MNQTTLFRFSILILHMLKTCRSFTPISQSLTKGIELKNRGGNCLNDDSALAHCALSYRTSHPLLTFPTGFHSSTKLKAFESSSNLHILEQKIEALTEQLRNQPDEMYEEEAEKLEMKLRETIQSLSERLQDAESELLKDKALQAEMKKEQEMLEKEIASLKREYQEDWKEKYESALEQWEREQTNAKQEIDRLQQEVRIVFSIGRRTSDKLVDGLQSSLDDTEQKLAMTLDTLSTAQIKLAELEDERQSLRKLFRLSWTLTFQRLRHRLVILRGKLLGGALPAVEKSIQSTDTKIEQGVQIRKTRQSKVFPE